VAAQPEPGVLAGRTILAVFAHPDDESLACGGTIARAVAEGARVVLFCASRGERGSVADRALLGEGGLGAVRARELQDAARTLGVAELVIEHHPDGSLQWADVTELRAEIMMTVLRCRPDAVITFDEDGLYWHRDHIGVHERVTSAISSFGEESPPLYYATLPKGAMREIANAADAKRGKPDAPGFWGIQPDAFGVATEPPSFIVDVERYVGRKLAALRCHVTQLGHDHPLTWIDEANARRWLSIERFRRAPGRSSGPGVLERLGQPAPEDLAT
jgi:N-acetyl-1-D-myo-inositol-2-amino-2-deoxy-alpha-D-glucopyranoside deacetylase